MKRAQVLASLSERLIPFSVYLLFFSVLSSASGIAIATSLVALCGLYQFRHDWRNVPRLPLFWPVLIFCLAVALSVACSPYAGFAKPLGKLKYFVFYFFLVLSFLHFPRTREAVAKASVPIAVLFGIIAVLQFLGIFDPFVFLHGERLPLAVIPQSNGHYFHARGFLYHHNPFGFGCLLLYYLALGQAVTTDRARARAYYLVGVVFAVVGILASNSRGAWVSFALSSFIILVTILRARWKILIPVVAATCVAALLLGTALAQRARTLRPGDNQERLRLWAIAYHMFEESPLVGNGFHLGFERRREAFMTPAEKANQYFPTDPHSIYFDLLGTTGLVGTLAFLFLALSAIRNYYIAMRQSLPPQSQGLLIAGLGAFLCFLIGGAFDSHLFHTETLNGMIFALALGQSILLGRLWPFFP